MPWDPLLTSEVQLDQPFGADQAEKIKACLDYLYGQLSMLPSALQNGSFEIDSDGDDKPDSWTMSLYPGGSSAIDGTNAVHGAKCLFFTHPGGVGNGGGYADSDYVSCSPLVAEVLGFIHWATNAAMKNQVYVRYYDKDKVYLSETQIYSSTANPTSAMRFQYQYTPPAGAKFYKIRLIGGYTDTNQAGTAYFDGVIAGQVKTVNDLKFAPGSWTISVPLNSIQTAYLQEFSHWPQMRASVAGFIQVFAAVDATLSTSNTFQIWVHNKSTTQNITWYGDYQYHAASEHSIYAIQDIVSGKITEIHIAERGNEQIASYSDDRKYRRVELTREMAPEFFTGKMVKHLAGDIWDSPALKDILKQCMDKIA